MGNSYLRESLLSCQVLIELKVYSSKMCRHIMSPLRDSPHLFGMEKFTSTELAQVRFNQLIVPRLDSCMFVCSLNGSSVTGSLALVAQGA